MTTNDQDHDHDGIPTGRLDQLTYSLETLLDEYGSTTPTIGLAINTITIAIGVLVFHYQSGLVAFAGAVVAIWAALAILKWVIQG